VERRPPIAPEHKTVEHRLYYHMQHPAVAKRSFRDVLEANAAILGPLFERLEEDYRTGSASQRAWDEQADRVKSRPDLMWQDGEIEAVGPHQDERLRAARAAEAAAEVILRSMDDLLTSVVVAFTGKELPLDVGQAVAPGVPLDRVLDAVGNYIRHRQGWRDIAQSGREFMKQHMDSIRPLARVISERADIDGLEAYQALVEEPFPMLRVLDALSGYTTATRRGSYNSLQDAIYETAGRIIDAKFPEWHRKVLAQRSLPAAP
jgi:hypothetical protein